MKLILLIALACFELSGAVDGTPFRLDIGETTLTVSNGASTSTISDSQELKLPPPGPGNRWIVWFWTSKYFKHKVGSVQGCPSPCTILQDTEHSEVSVNMQLADGSGTPLTGAAARSSYGQIHLRLTRHPHLTAPFTMPILVFGPGQEKTLDIVLPSGANRTNARLYMMIPNLRPGVAKIIVNGYEHTFDFFYVINAVSNGDGSCTMTTERTHNFGVSDEVELSKFFDAGFYELNKQHTVLASPAPTSTTFSVACAYSAGAIQATAGNFGKMASKAFFNASELCKWHNGINASGIRQNCDYIIPLANGELLANPATNVITFKFLGLTDRGLLEDHLGHGLYITEFTILEPDKVLTSITVSGAGATHLNAVASVTGNGFLTGYTSLVRDARESRWVFNGLQTLTATATNTATFLWGKNTVEGTAGTGIYDIPNDTYTPPTSADPTNAPDPISYIARSLIPRTDFVQYDPSTNTSSGNASTGFTLASLTTLIDPGPINHTTLDTCTSCHFAATALSDLRRGNFPKESVIAASHDRGLSIAQGEDIWAYILSLPYNSAPKARPWNPPYQPAPGLRSTGTIAQFQAGGGLEWVVPYDNDIKRFFCAPSLDCATEANLDYNGNLDSIEIPSQFQMPTWWNWWPVQSPGNYFHDNFNVDFFSKDIWTTYVGFLNTLTVPQQLDGALLANATTWTLRQNYNCTNGDYLKASDAQDYFHVASGCGGKVLTGTPGTSPTGGVSTASQPHADGAWVSNFSAYYRAGASQGSPFLGQLRVDYQVDTGVYQLAAIDPTCRPSCGTAGEIQPAPIMSGQYGEMQWLMKVTAELMQDYMLEEMNDKVMQKLNGGDGFSIGSHRMVNIIASACGGGTCTGTLTTDAQAAVNMGVGGHFWVRGASTTGLNGENYLILTQPSAVTFTFTLTGASNGTYTDAGMSFAPTGINTRSAAQFTRAWATDNLFTNGVHKSHNGGGNAFGNQIGVYGARPFNMNTHQWYMLGVNLSPGNRMTHFPDFNAMEYFIAFWDNMGQMRPAFWGNQLWFPAAIQNSLGLNVLGTDITSGMQHLPLSFGRTLHFLSNNRHILFVTPTEYKDAIKRMAKTWFNIQPLFSTAEWQTSVVAGTGSCSLTRTPTPATALANSSAACPVDHWTFAEPIFKWAGASSGDLDSNDAWYASVYAGNGHDIAIDRAYTCSFDVAGVLRCN